MSSEQLIAATLNNQDNYHPKIRGEFTPSEDRGIIIDQPRRELLTVKEVCEMLRLSRNSVHELRKQGKLEEVRMGKNNGAVRIYRDSVERYLDDRPARRQEAIEVRERLHDVRSQVRLSKSN